MRLLRWVAKKPSFNGFVNFGGSTFTREGGNQDPCGFDEQAHHQNDLDDVVEGKFEERPDAKFYIKQKKRDHQSDC